MNSRVSTAAPGGAVNRVPNARPRRTFAAWLGLLLLAGDLLAVAALPTAGTATRPPAFVAGLSGSAIVICTPGGLLVVDRDGKPVDPETPRTRADLCVFCLPLTCGGMDVPPATPAVAAPAPPRALRPTPAADPHRPPARPAGAVSARGPPLPA
ncbi:MAG TPA: hypothetical protein VD995_17330 [Azospirillum sp.]|nr:hypothetical protein [Azospirillum sp.]